jgi:hypothetical protein
MAAQAALRTPNRRARPPIPEVGQAGCSSVASHEEAVNTGSVFGPDPETGPAVFTGQATLAVRA